MPMCLRLDGYDSITLRIKLISVNTMQIISIENASFNVGILMTNIRTGDKQILGQLGQAFPIHPINNVDAIHLVAIKMTGTGYDYIGPGEFTDCITVNIQLLE